MSSEDGLAVVLRSQSEHLAALKARADAELATARRTSDRLDDLEEVLFGDAAPVSDEVPAPRLGRVAGTSAERPSFSSLRYQAAAHLLSLGVEPGSASFDAMLDPEEIRRIERRFATDFSIHARLDAYDVLAIAAAGLAASLLDILLVATPSTSPLTTQLRKHLSISDRNALAKKAPVPYDRIFQGMPERVAGMYPKSHRVQTLGHDPLLGLFYGTLDIMRGSMTAAPVGGGFQVLDIGPGESNPFVALVRQITHLLSDVATHSGLPLPGWTALATLGGPTLGGKTIGDVARQMYIDGFDSWHFASMATSAAAVDIVLRGYWGLRRAVDPAWRDVVGLEAERHGSTHVSDHPRFASLSLGAHGAAAAGNLVKVAMYGGNPLALNYSEWLTFLRAFYRWADDRQGSVAARVDAGLRANARAVEAGWARLDFSDVAYTDLVARCTPR
jgi:hypothetical protein